MCGSLRQPADNVCCHPPVEVKEQTLLHPLSYLTTTVELLIYLPTFTSFYPPDRTSNIMSLTWRCKLGGISTCGREQSQPADNLCCLHSLLTKEQKLLQPFISLSSALIS